MRSRKPSFSLWSRCTAATSQAASSTLWIGVERGKRSEDFLADLLDRGHCRRHVFAHNRQVFHVRFRPFYRAVGDENSRNRREHQPQAIKARLMTLDFVLAHPENLYFATEREKVAHVCDERGIDHEALPAKAFPSRMVPP